MTRDSIAFPTREQYFQNAKEEAYFPFIVRIDSTLEAREAFRRLKSRYSDHALLLESAKTSQETGAYSYLLMDPQDVYRVKNEPAPLNEIRRLLSRISVYHPEGFGPFLGGAAGLLGYELKNSIERMQTPVWDAYGLPDVDLGFYHKGFVYDRLHGGIFAFWLEKISDVSEASFETGLAKALQWGRVFPQSGEGLSETEEPVLKFTPDPFAQENYERMVEKAKQYIQSGDIFQANLSQALTFGVERDGDLFPLYDRQCRLNPTAFAAYGTFGDYAIACGSPERLVQCIDGVVTTRPIAGTRPRSADTSEDRRLSAELLLNPKERAEHVMLIDLERNDLGRVCEYGSVEVKEFMSIENYSHVRHIVSEIRGTLRRDKDAIDLLTAVFPGGTITGTPKVRSMQIIDELEGKARGPYTGSIGYIGFNGNCDWNIVIRTMWKKNQTVTLQVGAGIVADSDPSREYQETLHKAHAFLEVIRAGNARYTPAA